MHATDDNQLCITDHKQFVDFMKAVDHVNSIQASLLGVMNMEIDPMNGQINVHFDNGVTLG